MPTTPPRCAIIAASGSALPGPLATRVMDAFGDVLYNLYGSTEVAWASIATPRGSARCPGHRGPSAPRDRGPDPRRAVPRPVGPGERGRIFVGSELLFEGYTGGGDKARMGDLMATGDMGHFDADGRLFVDGRDDDMIVSGGENVFPSEVEDLLAGAARRGRGRGGRRRPTRSSVSGCAPTSCPRPGRRARRG